MTPEPKPLRAVNSASKISQRRQCPGSAHAEKGLPPLENPYAEEGTLLHWHDAHPESDRSSLTAQQRSILDRNAGLRQGFLDRELPRLGIPADAKCVEIVEREFLLCDEDGDPLQSHNQSVPGHPDRILWYPDYLIAIIFDSKFGRKLVEPAWMNDQLKFYFVDFCDYFSPETVIVAITQPWAAKPNDFHSAEYSAKDALEFKQEIVDIIRATEPENAPRHASINACQWCAANGVCPVAVNAMSAFAVQKAAELSPLQLEMLWDEVLLAEQTADAIRKRLKYLVETCPESVPHFELKSTGSVRSIDSDDAFEVLQRNGIIGTDQSEFFIREFCKFSVSDFQSYIQTQKNITKQQSEVVVKELLGDLLVEKEKSKSLARKVSSVHERKVVA